MTAKTFVAHCGATAALMLIALPMCGAPITIISTGTGAVSLTWYGNGAGDGTFRALEASWTQTGSYGNVNISAEVSGLGMAAPQTVFGTAFLTRTVGAGTTTAADEIARANFSATSTQFNPVLTQLFSGLTLGPGAYHLVLGASQGQGGGWTGGNFPPTFITAAGVIAGDWFGLAVDANSYAPASIFDIRNDTNPLAYVVTGDVVPEPSTVGLIFAGLGSLVIARRRRCLPIF
jgi:hypothetical protein